MKRQDIIHGIFFLIVILTSCSKDAAIDPLVTKDEDQQTKWVDSLYNVMTIDEKIGQLFVVSAFSNLQHNETQKAIKLITENHVGGLIFFKGHPIEQVKTINSLQRKSKTPLLITTDAEWGLGMRLDSLEDYPWNMTLGAVRDLSLIEEMGEIVGDNLYKMGVHINFAPVVDINTNPENPIIGNRSFGENKLQIVSYASAFVKGMQSKNIIACAKHFPGHGDTKTDSHLTLPTIDLSKERMYDIELYPYKRLIPKKITSIMTAHLDVPSLESEKNLPATVSKSIITNLLKEELKFGGLIITDGLNMKGVADYFESGELELRSFIAGNDILLLSENVPKSIQTIKNAIGSGKISKQRLSYSVKKILKAKYKLGLNFYKPIDIDTVKKQIEAYNTNENRKKLFEQAITLVKNEESVLPLKEPSSEKVTYVKLGNSDNTAFVNSLATFVEEVEVKTTDSLMLKLKAYDRVVIGVHKSNKSPWENHELTNFEESVINIIAKNKTTILCMFTNPYALLKKNLENLNAVIISYQNTSISQHKTAEIILGVDSPKGKLPISINEKYLSDTGLYYNKQEN